MALFKPFRGNRESLNEQPLHDGYAYFCVDDGSFHIDAVDSDGKLQRIHINETFIKELLNMQNDIGYIDAGEITQEGADSNG